MAISNIFTIISLFFPVLIVVYPDDRSKVLIRKVVGLPGDTIPVLTQEGNVVVPHGKAMIEGSSKSDSHPVDSRTFGPVDLRDIVGKVTQIYFSRNSEGIRWNRIGTVVNPAAHE